MTKMCKDCRYFTRAFVDAQNGPCHANPPTVLVTAQFENVRKGGMEGGDEQTVRPVVYASDIACRFHLTHPMAGPTGEETE